MSTTSDPNDLTSRLRRQLETDRKQIEETAARELERLGENLSAVASGALRSIERDTAQATRRMRDLLLKAWLRPLLVGLSLFLGISGGSWATMHWLWRSIELRIEALATLNRQIDDAEPADRRRPLNADRDRGHDLARDAQGDRRRTVRGPAGRLAGPSALDRAWSACREAVERVREP